MSKKPVLKRAGEYFVVSTPPDLPEQHAWLFTDFASARRALVFLTAGAPAPQRISPDERAAINANLARIFNPPVTVDPFDDDESLSAEELADELRWEALEAAERRAEMCAGSLWQRNVL